MPTFTFGVWLTGLAGLIVALLMLAPLAYRRSALTLILAYPFAIVIGVLNGLGHLAGSIYFGRWLPGATTAPVMIGCGIWLLRSVWYRALVDMTIYTCQVAACRAAPQSMTTSARACAGACRTVSTGHVARRMV